MSTQSERLKRLAVLLALHHCVVGWRRLHGPGRRGGGEGGFRVRSPADRVLGHLSTNPVQPPEEGEREREAMTTVLISFSVLTLQCLHCT